MNRKLLKYYSEYNLKYDSKWDKVNSELIYYIIIINLISNNSNERRARAGKETGKALGVKGEEETVADKEKNQAERLECPVP